MSVSMQNKYLDCLNKGQETALQILNRFSTESIQSFLVYARSVKTPPQDQLQIQHRQVILTNEELDAISILRDCSDNLISAGVNPGDESQDHGLSTSDGTSKIASWCTYCSPRREFKSKAGWARHEKETHEEHLYPCMPEGATEITERGTLCAICKTREPDEFHLDEHNVTLCIGSHSPIRVYKRRIDLVNHLKLRHGASNGQDLAENWKRAPDKKAWACGFCVEFLPGFVDRINHIYAKHYTQGADMHSWDPAKVIHGLLRQPCLEDTWSKYLLVRHPSPRPEVTWDSSVVKSLQSRLEMSEEPPDILVAAAYDQSNLGLGFIGTGPVTFSTDTNMESMACDAIPDQFPPTYKAPPDSSHDYNRSDSYQEPGSSDMDMAEFSNVNGPYLNVESMERSTPTFEPHINQLSQPSNQQLNDNETLGDVMDEDGFLSPNFFDEAFGDVIA